MAPAPVEPPTTPTPEATARGADLDLGIDRPTTATVSFSPLTTFLLGAAVEGEFRVHEHLTTYLAGEFYGAWMGWGVQAGVRWYPSQAFRGFFVDAHARASDLMLVHHLGGGLELGSQHRLGRTRWSILWSLGADVGMGRWSGTRTTGRSPLDVGTWLTEDVVAVPKLRLMLAYNF